MCTAFQSLKAAIVDAETALSEMNLEGSVADVHSVDKGCRVSFEDGEIRVRNFSAPSSTRARLADVVENNLVAAALVPLLVKRAKEWVKGKPEREAKSLQNLELAASISEEITKSLAAE